MVNEEDFSSIFDFRSAFEYGPKNNKMPRFNRNLYKSAYSYHAISIGSDEELDATTKENWPTFLLRKCIIFVLSLLAISVFPFSAWICVKRIHALERLVLMRLGRLQPVQGPGFVFILPCIDVWTRVDLRPQTFTVSSSQLLTADGGIIEVKTDVEYQIANVVSYVTKLHKQESTLKDMGLFCLRNIISEKDQEDLERNRELISCHLKETLNYSLINWGLEVLNVCIHSVKILKAAEPIDAIGTLVTALKAATGQSSQHTAAMFPLASFPTNINVPIKNENETDTSTHSQDADYVMMMQNLADNAEKKGILKDFTAKFRFDIVGRAAKVIYCCFENGHASVFEDLTKEQDIKCDVMLILSEDNLEDFLSSRVSPAEAYMDGRVMVTGDWSLLRTLAKVFE